MKKLLLLVLSIMTGFIFIVAFIKAVQLLISGIKWMIGKMGIWKQNIDNDIRVKKMESKRKREERKRKKQTEVVEGEILGA